MTWTDLQKTFVDILEICSPEKISVRLLSVKEDYFRFQDRLRLHCSLNSDSLQTLSPEEMVKSKHCLVRRSGSWHRGRVLIPLDQVRY